MDTETRILVESLHATPTMASLAIAGAGTQAIGWILGVAGASRTVLDIQVPYASSAVVDYAGKEPDQFVSAETARSLASAAYFRAARLRSGDTPVVGVACTATIATDRQKRGDHRCHVALHSPTSATAWSLILDKGYRDRDGEDGVVSRLILNGLAEYAGIPDRLDPAITSSEVVARDEIRYQDPLEALAHGHVGSVTIDKDGMQAADIPHTGGVIAGSFNPLHDGHLRLGDVASDILGRPVIYELSITNVDKPALQLSEVRRRTHQFRQVSAVCATRAPVFYEKARLFPGCTFVIGVDTMTRLVDEKYYDHSIERMMRALFEMRELGCSFLVAGRVDGPSFTTLEDVSVPSALRCMFAPIPESAFRVDISSTEIRMAGRAI